LAEVSGNPARARFMQELRSALHHLYEPTELLKSPLFDLFEISRQRGASALEAVLVEAIQGLKPAPDIPRRAKPWRTYSTLFHLYVQQFSQAEVANALAISTRQLRRQERLALQVLADDLWARYGLQSKLSEQWAAAAREAGAADSGTAGRQQELEWLERSTPTGAVHIGEMLDAVLKTIAPLSQTLGVRIDCESLQHLPRVAARVPTIRQALLNTLTAAIRCVPEGRVHVAAGAQPGKVCVDVDVESTRSLATGLPGDYVESLEMARQLMDLSGGALEATFDHGRLFTVRITLPAVEQLAVLVIDDNADTRQLFQRYLTGSRYPFIGAGEPQQALALAEELSPRIIVMDVMLPGIDGWELLGYLREHPKTCDIPVIVCTILPEEQLALALGAAAFMRKPVSRDAFLSALDRQAAILLKGSR